VKGTMSKPGSGKPGAEQTGGAKKGEGSKRPGARAPMPTLLGVAPAPSISTGRRRGASARPPKHAVEAQSFASRAPGGGAVERRRVSRVPIDQPLVFALKVADSFVEGTAADISLCGMFIATDVPAPFEAQIEIRTHLEGAKGEFVIPAIVRWTTTRGMGVQFGPLGLRETSAITEIVHRYTQSKKPPGRPSGSR
jgi:hypothetical protein